jgi:hypothetical protein
MGRQLPLLSLRRSVLRPWLSCIALGRGPIRVSGRTRRGRLVPEFLWVRGLLLVLEFLLVYEFLLGRFLLGVFVRVMSGNAAGDGARNAMVHLVPRDRSHSST